MSSPAPRILILPPSYQATERVVGGGERYAFEYARALAELAPVTLALFGSHPHRKREGQLEISIFAGDTRGIWFWPPRATRRALLGYQIYHAMVFPTPATDYLLLLARWHRKKIVLTDVGGGGPCLSTYLSRCHRRWNLNRLADGLALLSPYSARFFADWPQPKAVLLGGTREDFEPPTRQPQGFALFVGRLLPHKGVLQLIQAMPEDIPLIVVGVSYDPNYAALLHQAAAQRQVSFAGQVSDQELHHLYSRASVVVQPSLPAPGRDQSELLGLAAIEAMAHGTPVVVTRSGSLPDLVEPGITGFVVEPGNAAELRAKIELLCRNPDLSIRMGEAARRTARERFTWEAAARRGLEFYRQLEGARP